MYGGLYEKQELYLKLILDLWYLNIFQSNIPLSVFFKSY
jgi:hypothetical protein